jgi:hypothetical protein
MTLAQFHSFTCKPQVFRLSLCDTQVLFDLIEEVPVSDILDRCSVKWQNGPRSLITQTQMNAVHETAGMVVGQVHAFCEGMRAVKSGWGRIAELLARLQVFPQLSTIHLIPFRPPLLSTHTHYNLCIW